MRVYVVTDTELGWDNVVGVYKTREKALKYGVFCENTVTKEQIKEYKNGGGEYCTRIIHEQTLE